MSLITDNDQTEFARYIQHQVNDLPDYWEEPRLKDVSFGSRNMDKPVGNTEFPFGQLLTHLGLCCNATAVRRNAFFIQGDGGFGKTTLLRQLLVRSFLAKTPAVLISQIDGGILDRFGDLAKRQANRQEVIDLVKNLCETRLDLPPLVLNDAIQNRRLLLLFDGLNEISRQDNGVARLEGVWYVIAVFTGQIIVASRHIPASFLDRRRDAPHLRFIGIAPFGSSQICRYIQRAFPSKSEVILQVVAKQGLAEMATSPFLLEVMARLVAAGIQDLPGSRALLLEKAAENCREKYRETHTIALPDKGRYFKLLGYAALATLQDRETRQVTKAKIEAYATSCQGLNLSETEASSEANDLLNSYFFRHDGIAEGKETPMPTAIDIVTHQHEWLVSMACARGLANSSIPLWSFDYRFSLPSLPADWLAFRLKTSTPEERLFVLKEFCHECIQNEASCHILDALSANFG